MDRIGRMGAGGLVGASWLSKLGAVASADTVLPADAVAFSPDIEPLVRLIEDTPRENLMQTIGARVTHGLGYTELLTALLLAGVRNVQPRPHVGFKFHAVLVVNSAHLASQASSGNDRWLPIFWALDYFKSSQARDVSEGDWTLRKLEDSKLPLGDQARQEFTAAMESWDVERADRAVAGYCRSGSAHEIFEAMFRLGARDLRDIGHKAIYVANSYRTLMNIGWRHAEPVLRSLAYALLAHDGEPNPSTSDLEPDRPWRENGPLTHQFRRDWLVGASDHVATQELLSTIRKEPRGQIIQQALEVNRRGVSPQSAWDAIFVACSEFVMQRPGIVSLHALTSANALHFAYQTAAKEETRQMLLLQALAFAAHFRNRLAEDGNSGALTVESLALADATEKIEAPNADRVFEKLRTEPLASARHALAYLNQGGDPNALMDQARRWVFQKGTDSHDYKFSSAILEDYFHVSPPFRNAFLAAATHKLHGKDETDNALIQQIREALA
jgi:hypothetical protein